MKENFGFQFLHNKNPKLHTSKEVEHEQARRKRAGEEYSQKPAKKLEDFLSILKRTHTSHREDPQVLERIKNSYKDKYVTIELEDISQEYWNNKAEQMIKLGHLGDLLNSGVRREKVNENKTNYYFPENLKKQEYDVIISDQKRSLDRWVDYLTSEDADAYPSWGKYWAFQGMLTMGRYRKIEKENGKIEATFQKRRKDTTNPFPLLNSRALAKSISSLDSLLKEKDKLKSNSDKKLLKDQIENQSKKLNKEEYFNLISTESFPKIYAQFLLEMPIYSAEGLQNITGSWKKYDQGSSAKELVDSLEGYPLEWCTANYDTAKGQLQGGDFYVYYSNDENNQPVIPRVAIRMNGKNSIAEVRGIAPGQNLDPYISPVIDEKMNEFGKEGEEYKEKTKDMELLTTIWEKNNRKEELSSDELRFIYEIDKKILGFGYQTDPRIKEVLENRNPKKDLVKVFNCREDQISTTKEEALSGDIVFHLGDLYISGIESAEGLVLPEILNGSLYLNSLHSAEGLILPKTLNGYLNLKGLYSAKGLVLPETLNGYLDLSGLESAEGLVLPETLNGNLDLYNLNSAEGLVLPETLNGYLNLSGLESAEGLILPKTLNGNLYLNGFESAKGLVLPETLNGHLNLRGLHSAEGLILPKTLNGNLNLGSLNSAEGLVLPETLNGYLYLAHLESVEGLVLPETLNGDLDLRSLHSAEGLVLPETLNGYLDLSGLNNLEKEKLRQKYPEYTDKIK